MKLKHFKYFSTLFVAVIALMAGWWTWNYYMQSPWTRDGKVRAEVVDVAALISGKIVEIKVNDNFEVKKGDLLFSLDPKPFQIQVDQAQAKLASAKANADKAANEYQRRQRMRSNTISKEELDESQMQYRAMASEYAAAKADLADAKWQLEQTNIYAPVDGYITKMNARVGHYAAVGVPLVGVLDKSSFYVKGYFEETKLKHISQGDAAKVVLYASGEQVMGEVESIGRAISDLNESADDQDLITNVTPNVPWVRLAQRVPVRIKLQSLPDGVDLIAGTTCSIEILSDADISTSLSQTLSLDSASKQDE